MNKTIEDYMKEMLDMYSRRIPAADRQSNQPPFETETTFPQIAPPPDGITETTEQPQPQSSAESNTNYEVMPENAEVEYSNPTDWY